LGFFCGGIVSCFSSKTTSSHFKPGLSRWRLWLGSFLIPESLIHENHRSLWLPNQDFTRFPNFADSRTSQIPDSKTSQISTILK
jgi:hypothetical protein